jgi:hypothetical protein
MEASVETIIRIALMFFFIQFLVMISVMFVSMFMARREVPVLGPPPHSLRRSLAFAVHLPGRAVRSLARAMHVWHG